MAPSTQDRNQDQSTLDLTEKGPQMFGRCTYEDWRNEIAAGVLTFTVTLRYQYPAHDQRDGITWDIEAGSKAEAIRKARKIAERDGYYWAKQGRMTLTATLSK